MERKWPRHLPFSPKGCWYECQLCSTFMWKLKSHLGWIFLPLKILDTVPSLVLSWRENVASSPLQNFGEVIALLVNTLTMSAEAHLPSQGHQQMPSRLDSSERMVSRNCRAPIHRYHRRVKQFRGPAFTFEAWGLMNERIEHTGPQNNTSLVSTWTSSFLSLDSLELLSGFQNHGIVCL